MTVKKKWGILGTGNIAKTFAKALAIAHDGELVAVGSRNEATAQAFGEEFAVPRRHASYDALLADPDVDIVYISLPNSLHLEWGLRCADAGKHILCEKPLTLNRAEADELVAGVRDRGVFMMEAFMYRCHAQTAKLVQLLRDGAIGEVRVVQAHFGYSLEHRGGVPYENIRLRNEVGGGSIMDVGCYTVSAVRLVAGAALDTDGPAEPVQVSGVGHIGEISRVDEWASAVLKFPGGVIANVTCGAMAAVGAVLRVWGSQGSIEVRNPWFPGRATETETILLSRTGKELTEVSVPAETGRLYAIEADTAAQHTGEGQAPSPCMTWADSLGNMRTLDLWREAVGLVFDPEQA